MVFVPCHSAADVSTLKPAASGEGGTGLAGSVGCGGTPEHCMCCQQANHQPPAAGPRCTSAHVTSHNDSKLGFHSPVYSGSPARFTSNGEAVCGGGAPQYTGFPALSNTGLAGSAPSQGFSVAAVARRGWIGMDGAAGATAAAAAAAAC